MDITHDRRLIATVLAVVAISVASGAVAFAQFSDADSVEVRIVASSDFTIDVGAAIVRPRIVENESSGGTVSAYLNVSDPEHVDESRFTVSVRGGEDAVEASGATCPVGDSEPWDCRVTFSRRGILELVDRLPGSYDMFILGWWTDDRSFEAVGELVVRDSGDAGANEDPTTSTARTEASPTATAVSTTAVGSSEGTLTLTSTSTEIPTPSTNESATETHTPTPTESTATSTSTATETTVTSTPTSTEST